MRISFIVNGASHQVDVPLMKRLLDVLREDLRLTGTKEGCGTSWDVHSNIAQ